MLPTRRFNTRQAKSTQGRPRRSVGGCRPRAIKKHAKQKNNVPKSNLESTREFGRLQGGPFYSHSERPTVGRPRGDPRCGSAQGRLPAVDRPTWVGRYRIFAEVRAPRVALGKREAISRDFACGRIKPRLVCGLVQISANSTQHATQEQARSTPGGVNAGSSSHRIRPSSSSSNAARAAGGGTRI